MFGANTFGSAYFGQAYAGTTAATAYTIDAAPGSYALTGTATGLLATRLLSADPAAYVVTGTDATLLTARLISADPGTYALTGVATTLLSTRLLNAAPGTYILTGVAADLVFGGAPLGTFTLDAVPGLYTLTGISTATTAGRIFNLSPGSYQLSGYATGLTKGQRLTLIDHTPAGLTLVDLTGATLTLTALSEALTVSGSPTFNGDSTVTINSATDRLQAPASLIDETQCWVAIRFQPSWASTGDPLSGTNPRLFRWGPSGEFLGGGYQISSDKWFVQRATAGGAAAEFTVEGTAESFSAGDSRTVIFAFEAARIRVSGQGRAFTNTAAAPDIPNLAATPLFDIGTDQVNSAHLAGDILWVACGAGALTDADAATIHAFGDTDPSRDALPGSCTAVMPMNSAAYNESLLSLTDVTTVLL